jgi:8-oxo-dGTP pyrophosphatase MutT (NUDIX family)
MKVNELLDRIIGQTRWVKLVERFYSDEENEIGSWTFVERQNNRKAAVVVAKTKDTSSYIIIKQYRVPFAEYVFEFPAGLIDKRESPSEAALRELEEETGYRGKVTKVSGPLSSSAGLTSEIIYLVYVETDEEPKSKVRPEPSESIEVRKISLSEIRSFLANNDSIMDAKMYAILESELHN